MSQNRTRSSAGVWRSPAQLPVVISMGDPAGIGPEVTLKAIANARTPAAILVGDVGVYEETARRLRLPLRFAEWNPGAPLPRGQVPVMVVSELPARARRPGKPTLDGGRAAYAAIRDATDLVQSGHAVALVTAPISKANLAAAGVNVSGHTELLAQLTGTNKVRMMMVGARLRVVLVTTHVALARVPGLINTGDIFDTIAIADEALSGFFGFAHPRLAVAGLNPHAGECGMFGNEEARSIRPAVLAARRRGITVDGPLSPDSVFASAVQGRYDAVVAMYHDQGLAPFKILHFADGVNLTCGLPIVRTSPDHGTAYDIAGKADADPGSMFAAIRLAIRLGRRHRGPRLDPRS